MNVLLWHVHGSWTTAFVQGRHRYVLPVLPERGPDGRGRARTWDWPDSVVELTPDQLRDEPVDVVVLQRPEELDHLGEAWLGRRPGVDIPAVYLEHNAPEPSPYATRHPAADRPGVQLVHVTHFNSLMWDSGLTPSRVIEHGIIDPGRRYDGELGRAAVVINDPVRRGRATGTDLLPALSKGAEIDLFGMRSEPLGGTDLTQEALHQELAHRRVYLHTTRWTSLGLSLVEAMQLGMPVVALATTEATEAVPAGAGVVSNRLEVLTGALRDLVADPAMARAMGSVARATALARFGLDRFLRQWDQALAEAAR